MTRTAIYISDGERVVVDGSGALFFEELGEDALGGSRWTPVSAPNPALGSTRQEWTERALVAAVFPPKAQLEVVVDEPADVGFAGYAVEDADPGPRPGGTIRSRVLAVVTDARQHCSVIARAAGVTDDQAINALSDLYRSRQVERRGRGYYVLRHRPVPYTGGTPESVRRYCDEEQLEVWRDAYKCGKRNGLDDEAAARFAWKSVRKRFPECWHTVAERSA